MCCDIIEKPSFVYPCGQMEGITKAPWCLQRLGASAIAYFKSILYNKNKKGEIL
jgi:hypothetical protein